MYVIRGGFHTSDLSLGNAAANENVKFVVDSVVSKMTQWVEEYYL